MRDAMRSCHIILYERMERRSEVVAPFILTTTVLVDLFDRFYDIADAD